MSDQALVRRFVSRRDEASFRAIYGRHAPRMLRLGVMLARKLKVADVEDVMQEAWVRAARDLARFEWRSSLSTWLSGILINVSREFSRREWRTGSDDDHLPRDEYSPSGIDPIDVVTLTVALDALPDGYRKIIVLHDVGGYTHEEIAKMLAIDAGTSKSQLSRARAKLRARLREVGGE